MSLISILSFPNSKCIETVKLLRTDHMAMRPFRQVTTKAMISNSNCNVFASPVRVSHYLKCTFLHTENPFQKSAYILCCGCSLLAVSSFNGFGIGAHINGFVCRQFVQFSIPIQALGRKARTFGVHAQYDSTPFAQMRACL